jgi:hypothetical protein
LRRTQGLGARPRRAKGGGTHPASGGELLRDWLPPAPGHRGSDPTCPDSAESASRDFSDAREECRPLARRRTRFDSTCSLLEGRRQDVVDGWVCSELSDYPPAVGPWRWLGWMNRCSGRWTRRKHHGNMRCSTTCRRPGEQLSRRAKRGCIGRAIPPAASETLQCELHA